MNRHTPRTIPTVEERAQQIQDHFFARGAVVKKEDWDWLNAILTDERAAILKAVEEAVEGMKRSVEQEEAQYQEHDVELRREVAGYNTALTDALTTIKKIINN